MLHVCVEKEKQSVQQDEEIQLSESEILCCSGLERRWSWAWRCGWPPSTCGQEKTSFNPPTPRMQHHNKVTQSVGTSQTCIRSLIGSSRRGTWNAVWRRSPCGCSQSLRGRWRSNPAEEGWPGDNHPAGKTEENHSPKHIHLQNASANNNIILKMSTRTNTSTGVGFGETIAANYKSFETRSQSRNGLQALIMAQRSDILHWAETLLIPEEGKRGETGSLDKGGRQVSPGGTCRRTGWSWWRPPRASASRCCS